jgi:4'-phosphopantetheinyl transferase
VLRKLFGLYLGGVPATVELCRGEFGKPALADPAATLRFNLSHSGGWAAIALADGREVGIDIERIRPRTNLLRLADRELDPSAAKAVHEALPAKRLDAFHEAWTRREAIAKSHGVGLRNPLPSVPVAVSTLALKDGFAAALAVAGETMPPLRLFSTDIEPQRHADRWHLPSVLASAATRA